MEEKQKIPSKDFVALVNKYGVIQSGSFVTADSEVDAAFQMLAELCGEEVDGVEGLKKEGFREIRVRVTPLED